VDKSIVVPLGLFVAVVYTIKLLVDARMRFLFFKGNAPDTVEALYRGEERARRLASLRWGLVLCCVALGLTVAGLMQWQALSLPSLAVMVAALGLGHLASFFAAQHLDKGAAAN
jgi:fatty acid desaturase